MKRNDKWRRLLLCAIACVPVFAWAAPKSGEYLYRVAGCGGCHTAPGGKPFAGGVALQTPFGTLIAPNITPDADTGIGNWTDDEFVSALHEDEGGTLWAGTDEGLFRREDDAWIAVAWEGKSGRVPVHAIHRDRTGALWVGTSSGLHRLHHGAWERVLGQPGEVSEYVRAFLETPDGALWMAARRAGLTLGGDSLQAMLRHPPMRLEGIAHLPVPTFDVHVPSRSDPWSWLAGASVAAACAVFFWRGRGRRTGRRAGAD